MTITVSVAIPTFRRNEHLAELIPMVLAQVDQLVADGDSARLLIVDNDPDAGARALVESIGHPLLAYVHEPRPGLSAVRNRAIEESEGWRLLAFMDDDGRPGAGWLRHLVDTWGRTEPAAVAGRVVERYEVPPTSWIVAGGFFRRRSLASGTRVDAAPAGNLLLDLDAVRELGLRFDPRFGLSGGEDTLFTRRLSSSGRSIVWCQESEVIDLVPADRIDRDWVLRRARSHGNTAALVEVALAGGRAARLAARLRSALHGAARVVGGATRASWGLATRSERHQALGLRTAAKGWGMLGGATGHMVVEYAR